MPLKNIPQPEYLDVSETLRLRKYDGNYAAFRPVYHIPSHIYQNSEGIFDTTQKPDLDYKKSMCEYLDQAGEFYLIETKEGNSFVSIGDVTIKDQNPPIAIWLERYRGIGIGTAVMKTVIARLRSLGFTRIKGSKVLKGNLPSQKMHEKLGFQRVGEDERNYIYDLKI